MSCCIDLHYLLCYPCDLRCSMSGDWSGEVSCFVSPLYLPIMTNRPQKAIYWKIIMKFGKWDFVPPLYLSQLWQTCHKKQLIEKLLWNSENGISKTKDKSFTTTVIIFFINNKTLCTHFNPSMPSERKMSNVLKQICSEKLLFILSMYDLLLPSSIRVLKGRTVTERSFSEFLILALFK